MVSSWRADVTHVVTLGMPNSSKCQRAAREGVPVVHEAWVRRCWDDMQAKMKQAKRNLPKECTDDGGGGIDVPVTLAPVGPFLSKPLERQVITVTGPGTQDDRDVYESRITAQGGKFSRCLDPREVTLVLADTKHVDTAKVRAAIKHNIPVVTVGWLQEVEKCNFFCPLDPYYVDLAHGLDVAKDAGHLDSGLQDHHDSGGDIIGHGGSAGDGGESSDKRRRDSYSFSSQSGRRASLLLRQNTNGDEEDDDNSEDGEETSRDEELYSLEERAGNKRTKPHKHCARRSQENNNSSSLRRERVPPRVKSVAAEDDAFRPTVGHLIQLLKGASTLTKHALSRCRRISQGSNNLQNFAPNLIRKGQNSLA